MSWSYELAIKAAIKRLWDSLRGFNILFIILIAIWCTDCKENKKSNLIILNNDNIEVGILPEVGGRVVLLRKPGYKNILKADENLWVNPEKHKPKISAFSDFKAFNGHIAWVGPQSDWWSNQDINKVRRDNKADWPPDPYLIYGNYEIISKEDDYIKMIGPSSPVSGVRLINEITIESRGTVKFTVTAENIRDKNVRLDLWMNTRLDGFAKGYVPIDENGILKLVKSENETNEVTPYRIEENYFYFNPSIPQHPRREQVQEVHLDPTAGFIAGFSERQMLIIRFEKLNKQLIHPEHGPVELYNFINEKGDDTLLELEVHSTYRMLLPGETMSFTETWELTPYNGDTNAANQIKYLQLYENRIKK